MKTGKYSLRELLTHNEIEQFIIPELQRDYVWSPNEVEKVWNSFFKKFSNKTTSKIKIFENDKQIEHSSVSSYLEKTYHILNSKTKMGFVYAYHDKEMPGKFFLIDGQQRLTTFYLILLAIYVKAEIQDKFIKNYYENNLPKIDYKVRESAFEFLRLFLDETIAGRNFTENKNYFSQAYKNDKTVNNLIQNYRYISNQIDKILEKEELFRLLDYVENYIEFNYFDTKLSDQGESLYLYMNSRGFHLSHQEKLRANLIEKCSIDKKKAAGKLWEEWQDFFFEYRYDNENADIGFENFLHFSSLLKKQFKKELDLGTLYYFDDENYFQINELDIDFLNQSFNSLKHMLFWQSTEPEYINEFFKEAKNTKKQLFRYLSVWYFHLRFSLLNIKIDEQDLKFFALFILNHSHTREVADDPDETLISMLNWVDGFQSPSLKTTQISKFFNAHSADKIKLMSSNSLFNNLIFSLSFDYKLQELLEGRTDILFKIANFQIDIASDITNVENIIKILKKIFFKLDDNNKFKINTSSKLLRKYLLVFYSYHQNLGYIGKYGNRYNLINDNRSWLNRIIADDRFKLIIDDWILKLNSSLSDEFDLQKNNFIDEFDWRYYFIQYDNVLKHCGSNHIIPNDNVSDIILINKEYQSTLDCYLPIKVLENFKFNDLYFKQHQLETSYLDLMIVENKIVISEYPLQRLTIDLVYKTKGIWDIDIFYKNLEDDTSLDILEFDGFVKQENAKWRKTYFYEHNENSLKQNLIILTDNIQLLINNFHSKGLIPEKK